MTKPIFDKSGIRINVMDGSLRCTYYTLAGYIVYCDSLIKMLYCNCGHLICVYTINAKSSLFYSMLISTVFIL